jgi:AcrR family transcriptional regulator
MRGDLSGEGENSRGRPEPARLICGAMLRTVGQLGYRTTFIEDVLLEAGVSRDCFYEYFQSKEKCFSAAYEEATVELCASILAAGRAASAWSEGLRQGLRVLLEFVAEEPVIAKALILEGCAVGGPVAEVRERVAGRLTRAIDSARRQPGAHRSAPPLTAYLMVGAIEHKLQGLLVKGEAAQAPQLLGHLTYFVVLSYFGEEAAFAALDAAEAEA